MNDKQIEAGKVSKAERPKPEFDCTACRYLHYHLERKERMYEETLAMLIEVAATTSAPEYSRMRAAEGNARLDRDIARREWEQHQRSHQ